MSYVNLVFLAALCMRDVSFRHQLSMPELADTAELSFEPLMVTFWVPIVFVGGRRQSEECALLRVHEKNSVESF